MSGMGSKGALLSAIVQAAWCGGVAIALLLAPARVTVPARTFFLQSGGPLLEAGYDLAGDGAAAAGSLRGLLAGESFDRVSIRRLKELENQNLMLRESLEQLQRRVRDYGALEIGTPSLKGYSAGVVSYESAAGRSSVVISAGSRHGLEGGESVTASGAVAGVLYEVGPYFSRVRLLYDPGIRLPVRSVRTRELYALRGEDGRCCILEPVDKNQDIREGDIMVTTQMPGEKDKMPIIPPGMPVAEVVSVQQDVTSPLFYRVETRPLVELDRLENVLVLKRSGSSSKQSSIKE